MVQSRVWPAVLSVRTGCWRGTYGWCFAQRTPLIERHEIPDHQLAELTVESLSLFWPADAKSKSSRKAVVVDLSAANMKFNGDKSRWTISSSADNVFRAGRCSSQWAQLVSCVARTRYDCAKSLRQHSFALVLPRRVPHTVIKDRQNRQEVHHTQQESFTSKPAVYW